MPCQALRSPGEVLGGSEDCLAAQEVRRSDGGVVVADEMIAK